MEIMNIKEISTYLKCSEMTIRRMIKSHKIPYFNIGNRYFFRKNSIDEYLQQMENENFRGDIYNNEVRKLQ